MSEPGKVLYHANVLDNGFIRVIDQMGNDDAIIQAARVSYGTGTKTVSEDRGLIRYLMRHQHTTPFEMCEIKFHVKLPLFVARQWVRHRTASINEYSARYSVLDKEFYVPALKDIKPQSTTNKQGGDGKFNINEEVEIQNTIMGSGLKQYDVYQELLGKDLARETARMVLPTNIYTQWYWKVDLHNLFHFLKLRADPHAQKEIRVYAQEICFYLRTWVPIAYEAFVDYQLEAKTFSRMEMEVLRNALGSGFDIDSVHNNLSAREEKEFFSKIYPTD